MKRGADISAVEVVDISPFGIWLIHRDKEHFLDFDRYPWFRTGSVAEVFAVVEESPDHLRWPGLDVDLSVESILNPDEFPLIAR